MTLHRSPMGMGTAIVAGFVVVLALMAALHAQGHALTISVNLPARSLHGSELPALIGNLLHRHGIAPERLTLEITETAVMSNPSDGMRILTELDAMDISLAIDDKAH